MTDNLTNHIPTLKKWWQENLASEETVAERLRIYREYGPPYTYMKYSGLDLFRLLRRAKKRGDRKYNIYDIKSEIKFRREKKFARIKFEAELIDSEQAKPNPNERY